MGRKGYILLALLLLFNTAQAAYKHNPLISLTEPAPLDYYTDQADEINIDDSGSYYTGTDVESALQEIGAGLASGPYWLNSVNQTGLTGDKTGTFDISTSGTGAFAHTTIDTTLLLQSGSITDSTGAITFDNENLSTSGTLGAGAITGTSFIIGANTLTTSEWAFLDGQDQAVKTTSSPTFAGETLTNSGSDAIVFSFLKGADAIDVSTFDTAGPLADIMWDATEWKSHNNNTQVTDANKSLMAVEEGDEYDYYYTNQIGYYGAMFFTVTLPTDFPVANITKLNFYVKGRTNPVGMSLYVWNFNTSAWVLVGTNATTQAIDVNITTNPSYYISSNTVYMIIRPTNGGVAEQEDDIIIDYFRFNVYADTDITAVTWQNALDIYGDINIRGYFFSGSVVPITTGVSYLGTSVKKWLTGYTGTWNVDSNLIMGSAITSPTGAIIDIDNTCTGTIGISAAVTMSLDEATEMWGTIESYTFNSPMSSMSRTAIGHYTVLAPPWLEDGGVVQTYGAAVSYLYSLLDASNSYTDNIAHLLYAHQFDVYLNTEATFLSDLNMISAWMKKPRAGTGFTGTGQYLSILSEGDVQLNQNLKLILGGTGVTGTALNLGTSYLIYNSATTDIDLYVGGTKVINFDDDGISIPLKVINYNNIATEGYGVPAIVDHVALTSQGASINTTNFTNAGTAGLYRVNYYLEATTLNAGATSVTATFAWTDAAGATSVVSSVLPLTALGRTSGIFYAQLASGNLTYATTYIDVTGLSRYALYCSVERLN